MNKNADLVHPLLFVKIGLTRPKSHTKTAWSVWIVSIHKIHIVTLLAEVFILSLLFPSSFMAVFTAIVFFLGEKNLCLNPITFPVEHALS